ncbi:MAG TPA: tetratricopeptide repeat protein [Stellaceae bacterium]|nr:tetratricopeptide repeat protein [Stellaceae bacterium]
MKRPTRFDVAMLVGGTAVIALALLVVVIAPAPHEATPSGSIKAAVTALDARHYHLARRILDPLATSGNAEAEDWLGYMDEQGLGAKANVNQAIQWFTKASSSGSAEADRRLGQIYLDGTDVLQNVDLARQYLQTGAARGDADSQRMLGELYMRGIGVAKDPTQAYAWLAIAASQGNQQAASERDALLPSLPADTVSRAEQLAQRTLTSIDAPASAKS